MGGREGVLWMNLDLTSLIKVGEDWSRGVFFGLRGAAGFRVFFPIYKKSKIIYQP